MDAEKSKVSGITSFIIGITTAGMITFASLYFFAPKTVVQQEIVPKLIIQHVTNTIIDTVTNTVVVPKEIEKVVTVPAAIPADYIKAMTFQQLVATATDVDRNHSLFGISNLVVRIFVAPEVQKVVTDNEVRTRFELTLRKYGVPIADAAPTYLLLDVEGLWMNGTLLTYNANMQLLDYQTVVRGTNVHNATVTVWSDMNTAYSGITVAHNGVLDCIEGLAQRFANVYLANNPK